MQKKELIRKLKAIGKLKFYIPKPRSKENGIWQKIKKKLRA